LLKAELQRHGRRAGAQIAARTIDLMGDETATPEERAKRKRGLLKLA
jgi:hypothetical protein